MSSRSRAQAISSFRGSVARNCTTVSVASGSRRRRCCSSAFNRRNRARSGLSSASRFSTRSNAASSTVSSASSLRAMCSTTPGDGAVDGSSNAPSSSLRYPCISFSGSGFRRWTRSSAVRGATGSLQSRRALLSHPISSAGWEDSHAICARRIRRRHSTSGSSPVAGAGACATTSPGTARRDSGPSTRHTRRTESGNLPACLRSLRSLPIGAIQSLRLSPPRSPSARGSPQGWRARWQSSAARSARSRASSPAARTPRRR